MDCVKSFLLVCDLFGRNFFFTFNKQEKFKTVLGGSLSFMIAIFLIYLAFSLGLELFNKHQPKTNSSQLYNITAPLLNFKEANMFMAFQIIDDSNQPFLDNRYFTFSLTRSTTDRNANNGNKVKTTLDLVNCTEVIDQFSNDDYNYTTNFNNLVLSQAVCIKDVNQTIGGAFGSDYFSNMKLTMNRCVNSTSSKVKCKSNKEIDAKLTHAFFEFYYADRYIDSTNYTNPIQEYFGIYFILIDPTSTSFVDIYFKVVNITTDAGLIFEDLQTKSSVMLDRYRETFDSASADSKFVEFHLNSSNNYVIMRRIYLKFQEVAATLGGIMNISIFIGRIIVYFFSTYLINFTIIDTLFDFKEKDSFTHYVNANSNLESDGFKVNSNKFNQKNKMFVSRFTDNDKSEQNNTKSMFFGGKNNIKLFQPFDKVSTQTRQKIKLNSDSVVLGQKNQKIAKEYKITFSEIFRLTCFKCFKENKRKANLYTKCMIYASSFTDTLNIIQDIQEFRKLKEILLNEDQLKLFSQIVKPKINTPRLVKDIEKYSKKSSTSSDFEEIMQSYLALVNDKTKKNERILGLLDVEKSKDDILK